MHTFLLAGELYACIIADSERPELQDALEVHLYVCTMYALATFKVSFLCSFVSVLLFFLPLCSP